MCGLNLITEAPPFTRVDPGLDGSRDMLYIHPANNLIARLKRTKRITIEANFLNDGLQQMTFNVQGLKWDHKSVYLGDN